MKVQKALETLQSDDKMLEHGAQRRSELKKSSEGKPL